MVDHQRQRDSSNQRLSEVDYLSKSNTHTAYLVAATEFGRQRNNQSIEGGKINQQFSNSREQSGLGWLAQGWLKTSPLYTNEA